MLRTIILVALRLINLLLLIALIFRIPATEIESSSVTLVVDTSRSMEKLNQTFGKFNLANYNVATKVNFAESAKVDRSDLLRTSTNSYNLINTLLGVKSKGILLYSDAKFTDLYEEETLEKFLSLKVPIFPLIPPLALKGEKKGEVFIKQVHAPQFTTNSEEVSLSVTVRNNTEVQASPVLILKGEAKEIFRSKIIVSPGTETVIPIRLPLNFAGLGRIDTELLSVETKKEIVISRAVNYVTAKKRERTLLLNHNDVDGKYLEKSLRGSGYILDSVTLPSKEEKSLTNYTNVVLNNVPAKLIPKEINRFVNYGGTLLIIGGNKAYGFGGYLDSPIDTLSPLKSLSPLAKQKRVNVAVALVIDKSRSMADENRLLYAKEAAKESIRMLKDDDFIGVIGFDSTPFVVVTLNQVGSMRERAIEKVDRLFPLGRTNLLPALDEARRALQRVEAGVKHVIVLTDGKLPDASNYYLDLVRSMRLGGITLSTILLGNVPADEFMERLAQLGGGNFYQTGSASALPRIFLSDIKISSGEIATKEEAEIAVEKAPCKECRITSTNFPPLRGIVDTKLKEGAKLYLSAKLAKSERLPLLAEWQVGKGKVSAFSSDANGRWSKKWIEWEGFSRFFTDILGKDNDDQVEIPEHEVRASIDQGSIIFEVTFFENFKESSSTLLNGEVTLNNEPFSEISLKQNALGRYRGILPITKDGTYTLQFKVGNQSLPETAFFFGSDKIGELRSGHLNLPLLQQIAELSGGAINPPPEALNKFQQSVVKEGVWRTSFLSIIFSLYVVLLFLDKRNAFRLR
jgi:Mg-chelatase subunit ChlD